MEVYRGLALKNRQRLHLTVLHLTVFSQSSFSSLMKINQSLEELRPSRLKSFHGPFEVEADFFYHHCSWNSIEVHIVQHHLCLWLNPANGPTKTLQMVQQVLLTKLVQHITLPWTLYQKRIEGTCSTFNKAYTWLHTEHIFIWHVISHQNFEILRYWTPEGASFRSRLGPFLNSSRWSNHRLFQMRQGTFFYFPHL